MSFTPSTVAQAVATAAGANQANLASPLTALQTSITGGNLAPAAMFDALRTANAWATPTLLNSWAYYGSPYNTPGYFKDVLGFVNLQGLIKSGTVGTAAFVLPSGMIPPASTVLSTISNGSVGRIDVDTSGNVMISSPSSNVWVSLDGLRFYVG